MSTADSDEEQSARKPQTGIGDQPVANNNESSATPAHLDRSSADLIQSVSASDSASTSAVDPRFSETATQAKPRRPYHELLPKVWQRRQRLAIWLFLATCASTYYIGGVFYAIPLMSILLAHEMGHYVQARKHRVPATWPFFIPMPIPPLGTMGAVIVQGARSANRKAMFDIAVSGPIAGLIVALPVLCYGVWESEYLPIPKNGNLWIQFGDPLLLQWLTTWVHGPKEPGMEFFISPIGFAGWVGILITAINLLPVGQLDGGHIMYTLIGKPAHYVAYTVLAGGFAYMAYIRYPAYALLFILILIMGPKHPPTADDSVPLDLKRQVIGWLTLAFLFVGFTPRPIEIHEDSPPVEMMPQELEDALDSSPAIF